MGGETEEEDPVLEVEGSVLSCTLWATALAKLLPAMLVSLKQLPAKPNLPDRTVAISVRPKPSYRAEQATRVALIVLTSLLRYGGRHLGQRPDTSNHSPQTLSPPHSLKPHTPQNHTAVLPQPIHSPCILQATKCQHKSRVTGQRAQLHSEVRLTPESAMSVVQGAPRCPQAILPTLLAVRLTLTAAPTLEILDIVISTLAPELISLLHGTLTFAGATHGRSSPDATSCRNVVGACEGSRAPDAEAAPGEVQRDRLGRENDGLAGSQGKGSTASGTSPTSSCMSSSQGMSYCVVSSTIRRVATGWNV